MKRKLYACILAAIMTVTMTACGNASSTSGAADSAEEPAAADTASASGSTEASDAASGQGPAASGETVSFSFCQAQPEYQTAAQNLINAYMEEYPNVTIELITDISNLTTELQAGNIPEIFYTEGYTVMEDYADYITDLSDQPWVDSLLDSSLEAVTMDGKVVGFPTTFSGEGICYNKKMFEEHGWEVPTTRTELLALCEQIQAEGITPFTNQFADDWLIGQLMSGAAYTHIPDTQQFTDDLYAGTVNLADTEQMQLIFDILDIMLEYGTPDPLSYSWNEACSSFATGQTAMLFEGDWIWSTIEPIDPEIEVGMFPVPTSDNPDENRLLADVNMVLHVGKGSEQPEAAIEFLNWLATSDTAKEILLTQYQFIPCFEGWEYEGTNQLAAATKEYLDSGMTYKWWWNKWPNNYRPTAGQELQKYIEGELTAEETLQAMDLDWDNMTTQ